MDHVSFLAAVQGQGNGTFMNGPLVGLDSPVSLDPGLRPTMPDKIAELVPQVAANRAHPIIGIGNERLPCLAIWMPGSPRGSNSIRWATDKGVSWDWPKWPTSDNLLIVSSI
jgi:hypothetical protein